VAELPFKAALPSLLRRAGLRMNRAGAPTPRIRHRRLLRMNRAGARFTEARAAWTMYPPCGDEISARLMITQALR
jgi:hypothetical protein